MQKLVSDGVSAMEIKSRLDFIQVFDDVDDFYRIVENYCCFVL